MNFLNQQPLSNDTLPQQTFGVTTVALVSGTSFNLTLSPVNNSSTTRLLVNGIGYLQAPNSLHSTRVQITAINSNVVTVNSIPSSKEDPEDDGNIVVDLILYQGGTAYFVRQTRMEKYWFGYWGW